MPDEALISPESITNTRPQLLFHGTRGSREELIAEYGLLANTRTFTPNLELAFKDSSDTGIVTCWKPLKGDVSKGREPTLPISDEQREDIIEGVLKSDLPGKEEVVEFVKAAKTILPPSRLIAIGTFPNADKNQLYLYSPSNAQDFLKRYTTDHEGLVRSVEGVLGNIRIRFIDPAFTTRLLAEDVVHAWVEHGLLGIGSRLKRAREEMDKEYFKKDEEVFLLGSYLKDLQDVHFQEPIYERYRNMLITQIGAFVKKLS